MARPAPSAARSRRTAFAALLAVLVAGVLLAGCGGSSKPAYCHPVAKTKDAVKSLPSLQEVQQKGVGTLTSALDTLKTNAMKAADAAKSDFSTQTTALKTSVDALSGTAKQLAASPSAQTLARLAGELSAVGTAAKNLESAVSTKCS